MKKLLMLGLLLLGTTPVLADYCANGYGDIFTAVNGKKYCVSRTHMNWWSAHAWCDSIGMTLINPSEDCDCTGLANCEMGLDCPNLNGIFSNIAVWTNSIANSSHSYVINTTSHKLAGRMKREGALAACKK